MFVVLVATVDPSILKATEVAAALMTISKRCQEVSIAVEESVFVSVELASVVQRQFDVLLLAKK